jgi:asparagine synthase (glutamine-hydrolysing)
MVSEIGKMIYHLDEPQADLAPINTYLICKLARERGIKVLLSGAGGDDIFSGYRRHYALGLERYWRWLPRPMRAGLRRATQRIPGTHPLSRRIAKAFSYADLDGPERLASYFSWIDPHLLAGLYTHEMEQSLLADRSPAPLVETLHRLPAGVSELNQMLYLEGKHFLSDHNLNYFDKMSMATGVEVRVPLLDPDLISLATRLPDQYKQRNGVGKWVFRRAMESHLPASVIYRSKSGFGVPLRHWLRKELRPMVEEGLSDATLRSRGIFRPEAVRSLLDDERSGKVDAAYTILSMLLIEHWCRMFIDPPTPRLIA